MRDSANTINPFLIGLLTVIGGGALLVALFCSSGLFLNHGEPEAPQETIINLKCSAASPDLQIQPQVEPTATPIRSTETRDESIIRIRNQCRISVNRDCRRQLLEKSANKGASNLFIAYRKSDRELCHAIAIDYCTAKP